MTDAIGAMSAIDHSSQEISNIIGVVDEIAFQTNLLALNAGVEAARAGDAGRGFAVVASEVRALAKRTADAAKDIKRLISQSLTQVATGVNHVNETAHVLERITDNMSEICGQVAQIASSAREQAIGISEINLAIGEMDRFTQQNAAMVEQAMAPRNLLIFSVRRLLSLMSSFRLNDTVRNMMT